MATAQGNQDGKTLVVGAGLAGLVIAYRLRQFGVAVEVVEARDRPGGRIHSVPNALGTAIAAELGGEAFDSDHVACLSLAAELGLPIVDLWQQMPTGLADTYWFGGARLNADALQAEFAVLLQAHAADWQTVQTFLETGVRSDRLQALDHQSIPDYLAHCGASADLKRAVTVAYTIKYGLEAAEQSSLNLLNYFGSDRDCEDLFGVSDERFYLQGGNEQLPQAIFAQVVDGVQLGTVCEAITEIGSGFRVTLRQGQTVRDRTYQRVIVTIPFSVLRQLSLRVDLPTPQRSAIQSLGYNSPTKAILAYRHKPWHRCGSNGLVYTDLPVQHCWEASDSLRAKTEALLVVYPGGEGGRAIAGLDAETATRLTTVSLDALFPGITADLLSPHLLRSHWITDPYSQGAYSCYRVGQWSAFYGCEGQRVGHLFFAGEHCSRRYQGYMEGACETAEQVVLEILQDLPLKDAAKQQRSRLQRYAQQRSQGFKVEGEGDKGQGEGDKVRGIR